MAVSSSGIKNISLNNGEDINNCQSCHDEIINSKQSHFIESSDDCQFCHVVNKNSSDHVILSIKDNDLCVACHVEQSDMNSSSAHEPLFCVECHNPHGSNQDKMFNKTVVDLCREKCHTKAELGNSHRVGGTMIDARTGGELTCISTCHSLHNPKEAKLLQYSATYVCQECHEEMY